MLSLFREPGAQHRMRTGVHGLEARGLGDLVRGFELGYHYKETMLFAIDPRYGNLNKFPNKNPGFV